MSNSNKNYTPFIGYNIMDKNNKQWPFMGILGNASKFSERSVEIGGKQKSVVNFTIPVQMRARRINNMLGTHFADDETVWIRCAAWEATGERIMKLFQKLNSPKSMRVAVFGTVKINKFNSKDGTENTNVIMNVDDFWYVPSGSSQKSGNAQPNNDVPPQTADGYYDVGGDFQELVGDDDVPF